MTSLADDPTNKAIGVRLATVRREAELSQNAFAEQLGLSSRAYQNYERGERELPSAVLKAVLTAFQVEPRWLLVGPGATPERVGSSSNPVLIRTLVNLLVENWLAIRSTPTVDRQKNRLIALLQQDLADGGEVDIDHLDALVMLASDPAPDSGSCELQRATGLNSDPHD